jgi:hypothetical protein
MDQLGFGITANPVVLQQPSIANGGLARGPVPRRQLSVNNQRSGNISGFSQQQMPQQIGFGAHLPSAYPGANGKPMGRGGASDLTIGAKQIGTKVGRPPASIQRNTSYQARSQ